MPLSDKQMTYLALAWQCFESEPKIDYDKFKTVAGLASAHSARELMRVTKNKLKQEYGALSSATKDSNAATVNGTPTATPKKQQKSTPATPSSRKRATPAKGKKSDSVSASANGAADDDDDEEDQRLKKKFKGVPKAEPVDLGHGVDGEEDVFL